MEIIFFNRVAKSGSESMMNLLDKLGKLNQYPIAHNIPRKNKNPIFSRKQQKRLALAITNLEEPSVYIEHMNYINFTEFNLPQPIYINLVRDPIERIISWFYYIRGTYYNVLRQKRFPDLPIKNPEWYKKDFNSCVRNHDPECQYEQMAINNNSFGDYRRQSLFFCGHSKDCLPFNSPNVIQKAKLNVEKEYAVVGSWEDTNITLTVLEHYIPRFFEGAKTIYHLHAEEIRNKNRNENKPNIADDVKDMLRKNFTNEIDFYNFCKQRLYKQYIALKIDKRNKKH